MLFVVSLCTDFSHIIRYTSVKLDLSQIMTNFYAVVTNCDQRRLSELLTQFVSAFKTQSNISDILYKNEL